MLLGLLLGTLLLWHRSHGTISVDTASTPKNRGLLLGDDHVLADPRHRAGRDLGYERGVLVFAAALAAVAAVYFCTNVSRVTLFWVAFIVTRPLGATVGDFLDKPVEPRSGRQPPVASAEIARWR